MVLIQGPVDAIGSYRIVPPLVRLWQLVSCIEFSSTAWSQNRWLDRVCTATKSAAVLALRVDANSHVRDGLQVSGIVQWQRGRTYAWLDYQETGPTALAIILYYTANSSRRRWQWSVMMFWFFPFFGIYFVFFVSGLWSQIHCAQRIARYC